MTRAEIVTEIDRRIAELRKAKQSVQVGERIDELRVFKKWVERTAEEGSHG